MAAISFLQTFMNYNCPFIHRARQRALLRAVEALMNGGRLSLTSLGRSLSGDILTKHKIKCIDRLLGNRHLQAETPVVYRGLCHAVLSGRQRPVILVDWSDCEPGRSWLMLKAAVAIDGRALTLYEEVHPLSRYNTPKVHRAFLHQLAALLPKGCRPIIVTDAGFRGPWFEMVQRLGWDYIGRVRNQIWLDVGQQGYWMRLGQLYRKATSRARDLGQSWLSRKRPYSARLCLVRRKGYKDPWLLATSLSAGQASARQLVALFGKRMQIEETFRDLKDPRFCFGMAHARTYSSVRQAVLLLIGALAMLAMWLVGMAARAKGWQRHFQANTEKRRPVLSVIFLAREVLRQRRWKLSIHDLWDAGDVLLESITELEYPH